MDVYLLCTQLTDFPGRVQLHWPGFSRLTCTLQDIATFTAKCEKYVGTESGGMDQAISIMGQTGVAKMIEFNPVRTSPPLLRHLACWFLLPVSPCLMLWSGN
jgi:galactokinase